MILSLSLCVIVVVPNFFILFVAVFEGFGFFFFEEQLICLILVLGVICFGNMAFLFILNHGFDDIL